MLCFPCSAAFQTATTRRRSYTERQSRTRSTSSMILALLHNCHESKNDVRNALAAQIRKLEPKNYLETFKNKNLSLSTATTRRRSYTERQSRTRSTSSMILALLHNCHESKNDVRNALAAQIRKLEPKNYLESLGRVGSLHSTNGGSPAFLCSSDRYYQKTLLHRTSIAYTQYK